MAKNQQIIPDISQTSCKDKPRFIVIREYSGQQSMQAAFEKVIETQICSQFEFWLEKKNNEKIC